MVFPSEPSRTVSRQMSFTTPSPERLKAKRGGRRRVDAAQRTTIMMSLDERALLERLADANNTTLGDILRRSLHLYAETRNYVEEVQAA